MAACEAQVIVVINIIIICQGAWSEALRPSLNIPFDRKSC